MLKKEFRFPNFVKSCVVLWVRDWGWAHLLTPSAPLLSLAAVLASLVAVSCQAGVPGCGQRYLVELSRSELFIILNLFMVSG